MLPNHKPSAKREKKSFHIVFYRKMLHRRGERRRKNTFMVISSSLLRLRRRGWCFDSIFFCVANSNVKHNVPAREFLFFFMSSWEIYSSRLAMVESCRAEAGKEAVRGRAALSDRLIFLSLG
jgi:hypothetical protein